MLEMIARTFGVSSARILRPVTTGEGENVEATSTQPIDLPSRPKLTVGVEFEFFLAYRVCPPDPDPQDPRQILGIVSADSTPHQAVTEAYKHMVSTLKDAGLSAWTVYGGGEPEDNADKWEVKEDLSLENFQQEGYELLGAEITSPPLYYSEDSRLQISAFAQLFTQKYRSVCKEGAAIHVHVGNNTEGFEPTVLCNLMSVLWVFSDRLDTLHPPHRQQSLLECPSLRKYSELAEKVPEGPAGTKQGLDTLRKLRDNFLTTKPAHMDERKFTAKKTKAMEKILVLTNTGEEWGVGDRLAYNALNLLNFLSKDTKKTIEFRQHESTLDPERVLHWVNVCVGLVEFADTVDSELLDEFLVRHIDDNEEYTVIDLLRAIGRPAEADLYEKRRLFL